MRKMIFGHMFKSEMLEKSRADGERKKPPDMEVLSDFRDGVQEAFSNALQLKARLAPATAVRAPVALRERYPSLRACTVPDGDEQLPLV